MVLLFLLLLIDLGLDTLLKDIAAKTAAVVDWFTTDGLRFKADLELVCDSKLRFANGFIWIIQLRAANPVLETFGLTVTPTECLGCFSFFEVA